MDFPADLRRPKVADESTAKPLTFPKIPPPEMAIGGPDLYASDSIVIVPGWTDVLLVSP